MGKKVKVVTKCGEIFFYDHDQDVETVEIVEKKEYKLQDRFNKALIILDSQCPNTWCGDCAFEGKDEKCAKAKARACLQAAVGYNGE